MNRLNLVHNIDIADLMKTVDACKGDVFLETDEGDVLNLKSKFCQIMGIANILKGGIVEGAYIRCPNPDDEALMFRLKLYHEVPKKDEDK